MTNIYKNIYLRREEEVLYNIRKNVDETVETPTISKIIDYVLRRTIISVACVKGRCIYRQICGND